MSARRTAGDGGCFRLALHDVGELEASGLIAGYRREPRPGQGKGGRCRTAVGPRLPD